MACIVPDCLLFYNYLHLTLRIVLEQTNYISHAGVEIFCRFMIFKKHKLVLKIQIIKIFSLFYFNNFYNYPTHVLRVPLSQYSSNPLLLRPPPLTSSLPPDLKLVFWNWLQCEDIGIWLNNKLTLKQFFYTSQYRVHISTKQRPKVTKIQSSKFQSTEYQVQITR